MSVEGIAAQLTRTAGRPLRKLRWCSAHAQQRAKKPDLVVIWGDDIGVHNISVRSHGIMGYMRWNADNLWAFVPAQDFIKTLLSTIPDYPPQEGSSRRPRASTTIRLRPRR